MSRIGKIPVTLPKEVKFNVTADSLSVEGPKGKETILIPQDIVVKQEEGKLVVSRKRDIKQSRANHGTMRANLKNMIEGVTKGHRKELEIQGVGFRASVQGNKLAINLGFSHPVEFVVPKAVKVSAPSQTSIIIEGTNKILVGQTAATIRDFKRPEPYKGKGIRYVGEAVRRKQGKSVTK